MKLNDLITEFNIFTTNEEAKLLDCLDRPMPVRSFSEREQVIIENLLRKSLISKFKHAGTVLVIKNDI